jgi:hypothetical protein
MTRDQQVALWDAINRVIVASGGNPGNTSVARQRAVIEVERVVAETSSPLRLALTEALSVLRAINSNRHAPTMDFGQAHYERQCAAVAELERVIGLCSRMLA